MNTIRLHSPFWDDIFSRFVISVPDGYQIIEKPEHKKERIQDEIASKKQTQELYQKSLLSLSKEIDDLEKELKSIE